MARTMLDKVKMALRVTESDFDEEIRDLIAEAEEELARLGVSDNARISRKAEAYIKTYCRAHFSPDPENAAVYAEALIGMADELRRSTYYDGE